MRFLLAALTVVALALTGCGSDDSDGDQTLYVLAAASLTGSFDELAAEFEADHDDVKVEAVYDSSATLAQQVTEGAPADVLATADLDTMQKVIDAGDAEKADTFAGNTAVLVTPKDNPAGITSFADLDQKEASYVVCVDTAPCGKVAASLLQKNSIETEPKSFEDNVKAVLEKVTSGEVDAGIVYVTDAKAAGDAVTVVDIPGAAEEVTGYGITVVDQSGDAALAQEFVDLVLSDEGQQVLHDAGFAEAP